MTHYDVLGVRRGASATEIRRAYLRLARDHHPDRHAGSSADARAAAERRMREVNAAWRELGDPVRRQRYDEVLDLGLRDARVEEEAPRAWRPFDDGWDLDADDLDDRFGDRDARRPTGGRILAIAPVASLVTGAGALLVGAMVGMRPLVALGFVGIAASILLFVTAPLAIVLESRRHDRL